MTVIHLVVMMAAMIFPKMDIMIFLVMGDYFELAMVLSTEYM